MGDIHGKVGGIKALFESLNFTGNCNVILLGDAGCNFYLGDPKYQSGKADVNFKKKLSKFPFVYYLVRGNHEQRPSILAEDSEDWQTFFDDAVNGYVLIEKAFPNIRYFLDVPTVYTINGYKTLVMGGAYSVDKFYRLQNSWSWFEEEQMNAGEILLARNLCTLHKNKFDLILTHTCPICFEPTDLFLSAIDQNTVDKTMERFFGELEYKLDYKAWCWGHYHAFRDYPRTDGRKKLMLGMDNAVELEQFMNNNFAEVL